MPDQNVREQNLDAQGFIRIRQQGLQTVFAGPAPVPFHFQARLNPTASVFEARTTKEKGLPHLAITSFTVSVGEWGGVGDAHFVWLWFVDHEGDRKTLVTEPLVPPGTLHLAYPHPIVLPLYPSNRWSLEAEDGKATGALVPVTIVGYTFNTDPASPATKTSAKRYRSSKLGLK